MSLHHIIIYIQFYIILIYILRIFYQQLNQFINLSKVNTTLGGKNPPKMNKIESSKIFTKLFAPKNEAHEVKNESIKES